MQNLLDLEPAALAHWFAGRGEKPFRARQVCRWVHQRFAADISAMSDLAKPLRATLIEAAHIRAPGVCERGVDLAPLEINLGQSCLH